MSEPSRGSDVRRRGSAIPGMLALAAVLAIGAAVAQRFTIRRAEAEAAKPSAAPRKVLVTRAKALAGAASLALPGTVRAIEQTVVHARAPGFVRAVKVQIGDKVKKGALLAQLDAPELLDQITVAKTRLEEAQSNLGLAKTRSERLTELAAQGAASKLDADDAQARYNSARAAVASAKAEVQRLSNLASYLRVTAPFDATVTKRLVDPGANVNAGATALFELATTAARKVVVDVPQALTTTIGKDLVAKVTAKDGHAVEAKLLRTADALDEATRTLRVELALPEGTPLLPGTWVDVHMPIAHAPAARVVPAFVLSIGAEGTRVAVVGKDSKVEFRKVKIARDLGKELEITGDLEGGDPLVMFPPVDLAEGELVTAVDPK